jgi:hypothetical protein
MANYVDGPARRLFYVIAVSLLGGILAYVTQSIVTVKPDKKSLHNV